MIKIETFENQANGVAMSLAGFDRDIPVEQLQPAGVRNALLLGVSYIPACMGIMAIFLLIGYRLDEKVLEQTKPNIAQS